VLAIWIDYVASSDEIRVINQDQTILPEAGKQILSITVVCKPIQVVLEQILHQDSSITIDTAVVKKRVGNFHLLSVVTAVVGRYGCGLCIDLGIRACFVRKTLALERRLLCVSVLTYGDGGFAEKG
jgi:hypothetical protein